MTGSALTVDSTQIRRAAEIIDQASSAFAGSGGSGHPDPSPLTPGSLGTSPIALTVVTAAGHQLSRAHDATGGLASLSGVLAGQLHRTADGFEVLESTLIGHPR